MMDVQHFLRAIRAHWLTVLVLTLVGAVGAGAVSFLEHPKYSAEAQLFVSISNSSTDAGELSQGVTFAQERVRSYLSIVDSPAVTTAVIKSLNLPYTPDELSREIDVTSPLDTVLLNITVTDRSPRRAADIANAVADEFPKFLDSIETPTGATSSPVKASITRVATPDSRPVSPNIPLNLALGIFVAFAVGIVVAVLRSLLDKTIHGRREIAAVADAAVIGEIIEDPKVKKRPLITDEPDGAWAEAFRRLRTNIKFLSVDERVSSLVVTGSVPNEGKSTVAANLAIAIAQSGERVVLIDGDLRKPTVASIFSLPGAAGLTSIVLGEVRVETALQQWRPDLPLYIITSGPVPPNPSEILGSRRLSDLIASLVNGGMTVIIDSPPLLPVTDAAILARATQGALVVTRVGSTRADHLEASIESLRRVDARVLGVVANGVKRSRSKSATYANYYTAQPSGHHVTARPPLPTAHPAPTAHPTPTAHPAPTAYSAPTTGGFAPVPTGGAYPAPAPMAAPVPPTSAAPRPTGRHDDTQLITAIELREMT